MMGRERGPLKDATRHKKKQKEKQKNSARFK
jgi:hypothetical protein